jgi:hypothetical protein
MWAAEEKEIRRKDPPGFVRWSNPNELQATDRITHTAQGPGTSGSRRAVHATSARHPDTRGFRKSRLFSFGVTTLPKIKHIHAFIVRIILMPSQRFWGMAGFRGPFGKIAKHFK